jgi:hypothetical protein
MRRLARGTPDSRPTRRRAPVLTTMVTPLLLLALAACGEPDSGPGIASAQTGGATPSASATKGATEGDPVKFADCMRKYGVEVDVPQGGSAQGPVRVRGKAGDEGKMSEAQRECRQYAPSGGDGQMKPMSKADQEKFLKFAQCMRDRGIPMQDPKFEGGGVQLGIGGKSGPKLDESKVQAAHKACSANLPKEFADGPGGGEGPRQGAVPGSGGGGA